MKYVTLAVHGRYLLSVDLADLIRDEILAAARAGERDIRIDVTDVDFSTRFANRLFGRLVVEARRDGLDGDVTVIGAEFATRSKINAALRGVRGAPAATTMIGPRDDRP